MSPNRVEASRTSADPLTRRSFLVKAGLGVLGGLFAPLQSESQLQGLVVAIGLDLGKKLYEKGIDYAGGAILHDIFKEPEPISGQQFVSEAVTSIESKMAGLEAKIDTQNLDKMRSDLDAIRYSFAEYASLDDPAARQAHEDLLKYCDTTSAALLSLSMRYEQAFFLSTATLAYRLLTRFALFQLDTARGLNAQGLVTSLVTSGEIKSYFEWAMRSRSRLMASLAPQYALSCSRERELLPFATPKTECDILRANVKISNTEMSWGSESDQSAQHIYDKTNQSAWTYLSTLPAYKDDRATWSSVRQKSREQLTLGADCVERMYYAASGVPCPRQLHPLSLFLFDSVRTLSCKTEASGGWRCQVPP